ncbi:hypothetical protein [Streptomyces sp. NPDC002990]
MAGNVLVSGTSRRQLVDSAALATAPAVSGRGPGEFGAPEFAVAGPRHS